MAYETRGQDAAEQNHDGRMLAILAMGGVAVLGLFVAAVFGVITLLRSSDAPADSDPALLASAAAEEQIPVEGANGSGPAGNQGASAGTDSGMVAAPRTPPVSIVTAEPAGDGEANAIPSDLPENASPPGNVALNPPPRELRPVPPESIVATSPGPAPAEVEPGQPGPEQTPEVVTAPTRPEPPSVAALPGSAVPVEAARVASVNEQVAASGQPLTYRWVPGEIQAWTVSMTASVDDQKQTVEGTVELAIGETSRSPAGKAVEPTEAEPEKGTGSAFVVTSNGYLVTCAHVVQGATRVEVQVAGKSVEARVVAVAPDDDLALLKIEAAGLKALSLGNSEQVKLAEAVWAIGFPLATVLGDGVKVTGGAVSGIVSHEGQKRFQIDAAINPGNSGGPVVNGRGEVVAVASSKLVGPELSGVGLSVPTERVLALLKAQQVTPEPASPAENLDGPALAEAVVPSVLLVTVVSEAMKASGQIVELSTSGSFQVRQDANQPRGRIPFNPFQELHSRTFDRGTVSVDRHGRIESFDVPNQLPFLVGPMALLAVHPVDSAGRSNWSVRSRATISIQENNSRLGGLRPPPIPRGFRPRGFPDPFAPRVVKSLEAIETQRYRIKSDSDDLVVLERTFELTTLDDPARPYFNITGSGEVTFSRRTGLVERFEFDHHFVRNEEDGSQVRIPVRIVVARESAAVVAQRKRELAVQMAQAEHTSALNAQIEAARPPDARLDELLAKLQDEFQAGRQPLGQLNELKAMTAVPERRADVEALLLAHLDGTNLFTTTSILASLRVWGTQKSVPAAQGLATHDNFNIAQEAMKTLAALGDPGSVAVVVEMLQRGSLHQVAAKDALKQFGPIAEEAVLPLLLSEDRSQMRAACEILQEIGGRRSLDALEALEQGSDFQARSSARPALERIRPRVALLAQAEGTLDVEPGPEDLQIRMVLIALRDPSRNDVQKTQALQQLGRQPILKPGHEELEDELLRLLNSPNAVLRHQSLTCLERCATARSVEGLLKLAGTPGSNLTTQAVQLVSRLADATHSARLVELLKDPQSGRAAAQTLKSTGLSPEAEELLGALVAGPDLIQQQRAVEVLADVGSAAGLKPLDQLANAGQASTLQFSAAKAAARIRLRAGVPNRS